MTKNEINSTIEKCVTFQNSIKVFEYPKNDWKFLKVFMIGVKKDLFPFDGYWPSFGKHFEAMDTADNFMNNMNNSIEEREEKYFELKGDIYFCLESYVGHLEHKREDIFGNAN